MQNKQIFKLSITTISIAILMALISLFTCIIGTSKVYAESMNSIISRVWWFAKITHDDPTKIGEFPHYHSSKGYVKVGKNIIHMHSFHGESL